VVDLDIHNRGSVVREGPASIRESCAQNRTYTTFFGVEDMVNMAAASLVASEGALAFPEGSAGAGCAMI
jgi:hypothetical protein